MIFDTIKHSSSAVVKKLIDYGLDLNVEYATKNIYSSESKYNGCTPLQYCIYGSGATRRVLLEAGTDTNIDCSNIGDKNAKTLAEFYERNGRSDLAQIVREYNT